jgi:hypothetical protein
MQVDIAELPSAEVGARTNWSQQAKILQGLPAARLPSGLTEHIGGANDIVWMNQNVDISHDAAGRQREALGIVCAALEQQA